MTADEKLLAEFPPVSTTEWEAVIAGDLKGASYEETLIWHTPEGVAVRPYYRAEDIAALDWADTAPGAFPYVRGARTEGGWAIRETIFATDAASANRLAIAAIAAGAEEIAFPGECIANEYALSVLLANLDNVPVHIASVNRQRLRLILSFLTKHPRLARVSTEFDPLENVELASKAMAPSMPGFVPFTIDAAKIAPDENLVMQIARTTAAGIEYLDAMQDRCVDTRFVAAAVEFAFAIGPNYFLEIAKLRAFRMLWSRVLEIYGISRDAAQSRIAACTSYPPTDADNAHWNILRATTETMSAILGGADSICIAPFGEGEKLTEESARRLAGNTQLLLKHEALFARVGDAGSGSYYLETLTNSIADAAWKIVQRIDAAGNIGAQEAQNQQLMAMS